MSSLHCPKCQAEMAFITFLKAPSPWRHQCKNCGQKLKRGKYKLISTIIASIAGAAIGLLCVASYQLSGIIIIPILIGIFGMLLVDYSGFLIYKKLGVGFEIR